jgi:hypothetical protein
MIAESEAPVGGRANVGAVFRRGDLVERPEPRNARALHACLRALNSTASTRLRPVPENPVDPVPDVRILAVDPADPDCSADLI